MADCEKADAASGGDIQKATKGTPKPSPSKSTGIKSLNLYNFNLIY